MAGDGMDDRLHVLWTPVPYQNRPLQEVRDLTTSHLD